MQPRFLDWCFLYFHILFRTLLCQNVMPDIIAPHKIETISLVAALTAPSSTRELVCSIGRTMTLDIFFFLFYIR